MGRRLRFNDAVTPASVGIGEPPATCDFRFSLQNRYAGQRIAAGLSGLHVSTHAVTLSGRATKSEAEITKDDFIGANARAIRAELTKFLDVHQLPQANDLVILDMEPRGFAPRQLGDFEGTEQLDLITAYSRRISAARQVLAETGLGGLRLGMYQVIVPDGRGRISAGFQRRMSGYLQAGSQGMYDELDFICPVLYQRFGPDDTESTTLPKWVAASTRQAIEASLQLTRRNDDRIPLVPILSFWVFNGRSNDNRQAVGADLVAMQLDAVQHAVGIMAALFWSGWQTKAEMESAKDPVEPLNLIAFLHQVGSLPWSGCP